MRSITLIAKRDLKAFFTTPMFYMICGLCMSILGFSFIKKTIDFAHFSMSPQAFGAVPEVFFDVVIVGYVSVINLLLLFAVPAITMRLLAEEKKLKTLDLLLTSPITSTEIILGKFIAGLTLVSILTLIFFIFPIGSLLFTDIDVGLLFSSMLGVFLLGGAYVAIGLFASSLSNSMILSLIVAVAFNLFLWLLSQGTVYSAESWLVTTLQHLSIGENLFSLVKGVVSVSTLVYFLSLMGAFVFLSQKSIDSSRWR